MGLVVAIVNQKGGVGKTTVTLGLASAGWALGDDVLVVDADPQANATWVLGVDPAGVVHGTAQVIAADDRGAARGAVVASAWPTGIGAVDVLPAGPDLLAREVDGGKRRMARRLRKALDTVHHDYDLVLIDCSPALGAVTTNALAAADYALIVVEPSALSSRGIAAVSDLIDGVWEHHNDELDIAGVIVNRVPPHSGESDRQRELLYRQLGRKTVWTPEIPQRTVLAEAVGEQLPIHALGSRGAPVAELFEAHYRKIRSLARARARSMDV